MKKNSQFNKNLKRFFKVYLDSTSIYGEIMADVYCCRTQNKK
ncbi:MAG TPA: hypothetical protein QF753_17370 [Victivallales bacterium]|nr:hypothetical protein [Victivallales bacterium]